MENLERMGKFVSPFYTCSSSYNSACSCANLNEVC